MNYNKIISRGSKYVSTSLDIWSIRKQKMISFWCKIHESEKSIDNALLKIRIDKIAIALEERIKLLIQAKYSLKTKQQQNNLEELNTIIHLECPSFECRYGPDAYGTGIQFKHYVAGKLKCKKCGSELRIQDGRGTEEMLLELGIETN